MNYSEYTPLALRTESKPVIPAIDPALCYDPSWAKENRPHEYKKFYQNVRLNHCVLGLCSEFSELKDDITVLDSEINYLEEYGDLIWYINLGFDALDLKLDNINADHYDVEDFDDVDHVGILSGHLADKVKRLVFYGTDIDKLNEKTQSTLREDITSLLSHLKKVFEVGCEMRGLDISDVLERNIAKLAKRYPDKFSQERAENRDLVAEKKALDGQGI